MRRRSSRPDIAVAFTTDRVADGGVSSLCQLLPHLSRHALLITQANSPCLVAWRDQGRPLLTIPTRVRAGNTRIVGRLGRLWDLLRFNAAIYRICIIMKPRVVHCNDPLAIQHASFGAIAAGVFVVAHVRDTKRDPSPSDVRRWRLYFSLCNRIICLSNDMVDRWSKAIGGRDLRGRRLADLTSVSYSVVDTLRFVPLDPNRKLALRADMGLPPDAYIILAVGIISAKKGSLALVQDVAPRLRREGSMLILVGDTHADPEMTSLVRDLADRSKGWIVLAGARHDIERWYQVADVCVNNARYEGLARCMLESLACSIPVVSTDVCSADEILTRYNCGEVVVGDDPAAMADAIESYRCDSSRRVGDGARGSQLVRRLCDPSSVARRANRGLPG